MKFKVGDKIKVVPPAPLGENGIGTIVGVFELDNNYDYRVKLQTASKNSSLEGDWCPYYEYELERIIKPGEQLLFEFMN